MKMVGYLSLGYPTLEKSIEMADIYIEYGCDAVEISIPSPNPCYEKETIRNWMQEAYRQNSDYEIVLVTFGLYYFVRWNERRRNRFYRFLLRLGRVSQFERRGVFLWFQHLLDRI